MKKALLLCVLAVFSILQVMAQDRTITGTITSKDDGTPLPGVTVRVKGTNTGAQADGRGNYAVKVSGANPVLIFSFVGYEEQILSVGGNNVLNVKLSADQHGLNEVVVVGYGTKAIKDVTGATGEVKGARLAQESNVAFDQALSGKTAGVQINSGGGALGDGVSIHVRGVNSISMSSNPLYVIDGIPMVTEGNVSKFNGGDGTRFNPMALINPNDIESITVLKDAGATVIYGSRGANGVIMITTKRGKQGSSKVSVDSKAYWSQVTANPKMLNGDQFITINNEKESNAANKFGGVHQIAFESDIDGDGKNDRTDWIKEIYGTNFSHDNTISMSGGTEKATYYGSARFSDQKGAIYGNTLKTGQIRLNFDVTPTKWFKSGLNLSYTKALNQGVLTDRYLAGATVSGYNAFPTLAVRNPANDENGFNLNSLGLLGLGNNITSLNGTGLVANSIYNVIANVDLGRNNNTVQHVISNAYGEIQPIRGLKLTSKVGVDFLENFEDQFSSPYIAGLGLGFNGLVQDNYTTEVNWVWSNYLNFDRTFGEDHHVSFTAGEESQFSKQRQTYAGASDFADPFFKDILDGTYSGNDDGGNLQLWSGGGLASYGLQSYFGRLGYSYKDKYLIEAAYRQDAFSAFGADNQWGHFPSVSAGWIISQENFLKSAAWINFLKLRASYGKTGNSRFGDPFGNAYAARTLYGGGLYASENGLSTAQSGNSALKWETSNKFDVGADFNIYNNRLRFVVDYFRNDISGLLLNAPVLATVGIPGSSILTNIGSMYNHGIEFTVNANTMTKKDFTWTTSFNFTYIKNRVTSLVSSTDLPDGTFSPAVASIGRTIGEYKLIRWAGVDPETGNSSFLAKDGTRKFYDPSQPTASRYTLADKSVTSAISGSDAVYTGKSGTPKFYGGLDNNFAYKNFDLGITFSYTGGFYIYNATKGSLLSNYFNNNSAEILGRWTTPGQKTDIPRLYLTDNVGNQTSTRFLEKGDYLRCRTISLGYTFRQPFMTAAKLSNLRVYAQVYNPFVITGYSGPDPEISYARNSNIALAVDNRQAPQMRTYTIGLNVGF